jgi:predicted transposase/invertase (TIGR01784 family)
MNPHRQKEILDIMEPETMFDDVTFKIINVGDKRINRLNDRFVRYLLAGERSKPFLIAFINAALLLKGNDKIIDLDIIPGELHGPDAKTKLSILDVSAKLVDRRTVDVEVQVINQHDFRKRGPFYLAKRHSVKLQVGSKITYAGIKASITICLLAFDLLEEEEDYRNSYSFRNDKSGKRLCDDMQLIYLELPKFLKLLGADHPRTGLERWLLYFCNEEGARMEKVMAEDSVLANVKGVELSFWADEKERELYFQYQKYLMDAYSDEHTYEFLLQQERERAEREKEKAAQDALEQGLKQGKQEMAHNLLELGMNMDQIVQASGLSEEEIRELQINVNSHNIETQRRGEIF